MLGTIFNVAPEGIQQSQGVAGDVFTSFMPLMYLVIGIPLGLWIVLKIVALARGGIGKKYSGLSALSLGKIEKIETKLKRLFPELSKAERKELAREYETELFFAERKAVEKELGRGIRKGHLEKL